MLRRLWQVLMRPAGWEAPHPCVVCCETEVEWPLEICRECRIRLTEAGTREIVRIKMEREKSE